MGLFANLLRVVEENKGSVSSVVDELESSLEMAVEKVELSGNRIDVGTQKAQQ
jgi:hypothetical protein